MLPSSESTSSYHLAIAQIDEEVVQHKLAIHNLYTRRNSLSLIIRRLPDELLASIFVHCARNYYNTCSTSHHPANVPNWVNVSYVCSHWRNVALNCPSVWSYISTTSQRWTEELLARSKKAPLKIHVKIDDRRGSWWMKLTEKMGHHRERIEELRLLVMAWWGRREDYYFSELAPLTNLRSFEFSMQHICHPEPDEVLFDTQTQWNMCGLSGLTTLSLHSTPISLQLDTSEFLAMLGGTRNIVNLYLDDALASARDLLSSEEFNALEKINLPSLSRLLVLAPVSTVTALLSCMNIPVSAERRLVCKSEASPDPDDYNRLQSILAQNYDGDQSLVPIIRSVFINCQTRELSFTFSASLCNPTPSLYFSTANIQWGRGIPLEIVLKSPTPWTGALITDITDEFFFSVPMANVESLHVFDPPSCVYFWKETLGHLPGLRHIKLRDGAIPNLASALSLTEAHESADSVQGDPSGDATHDPNTGHVLAPALEELKLDRIFLGTRAQLQTLYDALAGREASRGRLTMTSCESQLDVDRGTLYDMVGSWEGGCFRVLSEHRYPSDWASDLSKELHNWGST